MLKDFCEHAHIMNVASVDDGYGGKVETLTVGRYILAGFAANGGTQIVSAGADAVKDEWVIICAPHINIPMNGIVKRDSDGRLFRVTGVCRTTPSIAEVKFKRYSAEVISR